jgi:hypothetical protein
LVWTGRKMVDRITSIRRGTNTRKRLLIQDKLSRGIGSNLTPKDHWQPDTKSILKITGDQSWNDEDGEVAEWLKAPLSKSGILLIAGSWVRTPPSPPPNILQWQSKKTICNKFNGARVSLGISAPYVIGGVQTHCKQEVVDAQANRNHR